MDKGGDQQLPPPTLDQFATEVATSAMEQWLDTFVKQVARLLDAADVALFVRGGAAHQPLAATGDATTFDLRPEDGDSATLRLPLPAATDAELWARASLPPDEAQQCLAGWLAIVGLGLAHHQEVQQAERQRTARDHFFSMVNHDLKGPLSSIKAMSDLMNRKLQRGSLDPATADGRADLMERLGFLSQRVKDLADLIDEIGELSYIERGRLALNRQDVNLGSLLRTVIERIEHEQGRAVQTDGLDDADILLNGDARRLAELFHHLLKNAATHTPADTPITVSLSATEADAIVTVQDKGSGIGAEQQAHLFHSYGRAVQRGATGLGGGLFLVNALATAHGGAVALDSAPDTGTTVRVTLPRLQTPS